MGNAAVTGIVVTLVILVCCCSCCFACYYYREDLKRNASELMEKHGGYIQNDSQLQSRLKAYPCSRPSVPIPMTIDQYRKPGDLCIEPNRQYSRQIKPVYTGNCDAPSGGPGPVFNVQHDGLSRPGPPPSAPPYIGPSGPNEAGPVSNVQYGYNIRTNRPALGAQNGLPTWPVCPTAQSEVQKSQAEWTKR